MRTSKAKHLKSTVRNRIRAGASQRSIVQEFGDRVPVSTLRHWFKTMQREISAAPNLRLIELRDDLRDEIDELKVILKEEIEHPSKDCGVRVQAINTFLRVLEHERMHYPTSLKNFCEMLIRAGVGPDEFMQELAAAHQRAVS